MTLTVLIRLSMLGSDYVTPHPPPPFRKNSEVVNILTLLLVQGAGIVLSLLSIARIVTVAFLLGFQGCYGMQCDSRLVSAY